MARDKEYNQLIHTTRWLKLRKEVLTEHPCCHDCERNGIITAATEVHHISPVEEATSYMERTARMYDPTNLMALCHACHVLRHKEMRKGTKKETIARNRKQVADIISTFYGENGEEHVDESAEHVLRE